MVGRTIILVSHHTQLCAPGASYIVALDNGRVQFEGSRDAFYNSAGIASLIQSTQTDVEPQDDKGEKEALEAAQESILSEALEPESKPSSTIASTPPSVKLEKKSARKLVEEEKRAVGRISRDIWETYIWACGSGWYWTIFIFILIVASASPVLENGWLRCASHYLSP
jgi:ABC-type multidrug transport system ATPase subunit